MTEENSLCQIPTYPKVIGNLLLSIFDHLLGHRTKRIKWGEDKNGVSLYVSKSYVN